MSTRIILDIATITIDKLVNTHKVDFKACISLEDVIEKVDDYIDYYNHRYQWSLKKMTPKQFRNHLLNVD